MGGKRQVKGRKMEDGKRRKKGRKREKKERRREKKRRKREKKGVEMLPAEQPHNDLQTSTVLKGVGTFNMTASH